MHAYLRQIYDAFGPTRMFWGTDLTKMPCSWRQCVTMSTNELPWLPERDKPLVMGVRLVGLALITTGGSGMTPLQLRPLGATQGLGMSLEDVLNMEAQPGDCRSHAGPLHGARGSSPAR